MVIRNVLTGLWLFVEILRYFNALFNHWMIMNRKTPSMFCFKTRFCLKVDAGWYEIIPQSHDNKGTK